MSINTSSSNRLTPLQITGITIGVLLVIAIFVVIVVFATRSSGGGSTISESRMNKVSPDTCSVKTDCAAGFVCSSGSKCVPGCEKSTDCPDTETCIAGVCVTSDGKQSVSLKGTSFEDPIFVAPKEPEYVSSFRADVGDFVEMKFTLKDSATDLCAPATGLCVAYGKVQIKTDDTVGIEWTYLSNPNYSKKYDPWNCCWFRNKADNAWNLKYLGDATINPTYDSGLKSVFTKAEAGKLLRKTIIDIRECPTNPWATCPDDYVEYGKPKNQFCCKGTVDASKSTCDGEACARYTTNNQGANWCSNVGYNDDGWYFDKCPIGTTSYGDVQNQYCCSSPLKNGTCPSGSYKCVNKLEKGKDIKTTGMGWCETNPNYVPKKVTIRGGAGKYCQDTSSGIICNLSSPSPMSFEVREYPASSAMSPTPFAIKSPKSGKWCRDEGSKVLCDQDIVGQNSLFYRLPINPLQTSIMGGKYTKWCSDEGSANYMTCVRDNVGGWESFVLNYNTVPPTTVSVPNPIVNNTI